MSAMISIGMHHDSTYTISKKKKNEQPNIALTIRRARSGYRTPRKRTGGKPKTQPRRERSFNLATSKRNKSPSSESDTLARHNREYLNEHEELNNQWNQGPTEIVNEDEDSTDQSISIPVNETKSTKRSASPALDTKAAVKKRRPSLSTLKKQKSSGSESDATSSSHEDRLNESGDDIRDDVPSPPKVNRKQQLAQQVMITIIYFFTFFTNVV